MSHKSKVLLFLLLIISITGISSVFAESINTKNYKDINLKIPAYKQQYANSCEASTLRMALAYKGIKISNDVSLLSKFGYNPTYKDWTNNIWDDPQKQYVGYVEISGRPYGGYGVYGLPVVKAVESFGKKAEYETSTNIKVQDIAKAIDEKNPVLFWGYTSLKEPVYTWKTKEGREVTAVKGEHVRVVVGYKGTINKPIGFYIHDSFTGKAYEYWTAEKLIAHINKVPGVTDQIVIVK